MAAPVSTVSEDPAQRRMDDRLGSWKAISAYLKRDVSTVQRWEKSEGMPVHRHLHSKRGSVYAFRDEIDAWWTSRGLQLDSDHGPAALRASDAASASRRGMVIALVVVLLGAAIATAWLLGIPGRGGRDPLADAAFSTLTDFDGIEQGATISRDGKFAAFLADREEAWDVWITQIGTGEFHNLTRGRAPALQNQEVRNLAFSPDGSLVILWGRSPDSAAGARRIDLWAVPTMGGALRPYVEGAAELDWSSDGTRIAYHTPEPGDPMFVTDSNLQVRRQIHAAAPGVHNHFPVWSPDDAYLYFVRGTPPDRVDIWRLRADTVGAEPQQMTAHDSRVSHPVFVDRRTLMYLATAEDGSGPWLHALDVKRGTTRRIGSGVDRYTSLAASADGRRLVATVARPRSGLMRASLEQGVVDASAASAIALPTTGGRSPRFGPGYLVYVAAKGSQDAIWKLADDPFELWSAPRTHVAGGPAVSPDGRRIAFTVEREGQSAVNVMKADGTELRSLAASLDVRGAPAWSRDGRSLTVSAWSTGRPRLFRVPLDGRAPAPLVDEYAVDPSWSPDGRLLVYSGAEVGPSFTVKAMTAEGRPQPLPPLTLSRGARRLSFLAGGAALVVMRGEIGHLELWSIEFDTGAERQLTNFAGEFAIGDFDVSADGREIVFDRRADEADIVLIDRHAR